MSVVHDRPVIAVDFDGTIVDFDYPRIGALKDGAKEAIALFRQIGYQIIIYSCRACTYFPNDFGTNMALPPLERWSVKEMKEFLDREGIVYDEIDDGLKGKPFADFYIDDKGVRFENNWNEVMHFVLKNTKVKF